MSPLPNTQKAFGRGEVTNMNGYTTIESFQKSKLYYRFLGQRVMKKVSWVALIILVCFSLWFAEMVVATAHVPAEVTLNIYHFTK